MARILIKELIQWARHFWVTLLVDILRCFLEQAGTTKKND